MRLLNVLRLLVDSTPPVGLEQGAVYYDSLKDEPRYYDGDAWREFGVVGVPSPITAAFTIPAGRQVMYFDKITNDGVLTITDTATLVGTR